jgi:ABC-type Co2+ transport system permease subunit
MASMILEWGYARVLLIAILLLLLLIVLLRGALSRGRDWFFAATAAACLVTIACETYCHASFDEITVKMLATIIVVMVSPRPSATKRSNRLDGLCGSVGERRPQP